MDSVRVSSENKRQWRRLLPVVLVASAVALAGCSAVQKGAESIKDAGKSDTGRSKVGDCINVIEGSMINSKTEPVDCASPKAVYKVAKHSSAKAECAADYTSYEETLNGASMAYLCLAPNFQTGACYHESMMTGYQYAECGSTNASFQVLTRIDGQSDENLCGPEADKVITLTEQPTTFCLKDL
ncbi:LppU/SCO3897 family protein [Nocardia sp. CA-136227]|uniref:LppU/SCO3897 family protein n=1 Tax=Nocardia sp. CA-136227 TaxID=3239979 RepID=UPI003D96C5DC